MRTILAWLFPPRLELAYQRSQLDEMGITYDQRIDHRNAPLAKWEEGAVKVACPPEVWRRTFSLYLNN